MKTVLAAILLAPTVALAQPHWVGQIGDKLLVDVDGTLHSIEVGETAHDLKITDASDSFIDVVWRGSPLRLELGQGSPNPIVKTSVEIPNYGDGFKVDGFIEGAPVKWLVDTGSSAVAISESLAMKIGIQPETSRPVVNTAGGLRQGWFTNIARLQMGDWILKDVEAVILPGDYPSQPLLGLSALERFNLNISADKMVLEPVQGSGIIRSP